MRLKERQTKFIAEFILNPNASAAARAAGYAESSARVTASRLLSNNKIKGAIALKKHHIAQEYEITKKTVINELLGAAEMARVKNDAGSMIRAWCEIAKIMGFYDPEFVKVGFSSENDSLRAKIESMSDDELYALSRG